MGFDKFGWVSYVGQTKVSKFTDYLADGKIYGTKCLECGNIQFPPRAHCVSCLSTSFDWKQLSGDCTLITSTKVDESPATFKDQAPYVLGLAKFTEGPKVFAWVDKTIPLEQIRVGMKMKLKARELGNSNLSYTLTISN